LLTFIPLLLIGHSSTAQWHRVKDFSDANGLLEQVTCIYFLPTQPNIGYVGTTSELWKTTDSGKEWSVCWPETHGRLVFVSDICFKDSTTGWFSYNGANGGAVYKTVNGGLSWYILQNSITQYPVGGIRYSATTNRLFLCLNTGGLIMSPDLGETWYPVTSSEALGITFFSDKIGIVTTADTSLDLLRTSDGGLTWSLIPVPFGACIQPLAIQGTSTCFAATTAEIGIFQSDDFGKTWKQVYDFGPPWDSLYRRTAPYGTGVIEGDLSHLTIQTDIGLYVSTDEGNSWNSIGGPPAINSGESHRFFSSGGAIFAGLDTGGVDGYGSFWRYSWPQSSVHEQPPPTDGTTLSLTNNSLSISSGARLISGELLDITGRTLLTLPGERRTSLQANIGELPSGIYFVRIETDRGSEMKKIAVMR